MNSTAKPAECLQMKFRGNRIEITVADSPQKLRDFRDGFASYAPLLDRWRGEPSLDDLKRMGRYVASAVVDAELTFVLHIEAEEGVIMKREVRVYPDKPNAALCAIARWIADVGFFVGAIN